MIILSPLKALTLSQPSNGNRHSHLSAASGLVQIGDWLYVVADDENHLGIFRRDTNESGYLQALFHGDLPLTPKERKAAKPDLEVLTLILATKHYPHGALLALGSGSKESRTRGAIIAFDEHGDLKSDVEIIDLTLVYHHLKEACGKLNIEGAIIQDKDIILFQRGNKKNNLNATIRFPLKAFFEHVYHPGKNTKLEFEVAPYQLGDIDGVPLCFTDATTLPDGSIVFTAAAENTSDAYLDGACMGSAIGIIHANGELHSIKTVDKTVKVEGVTATITGNQVHLLLVTDADDETLPAQVYSAVLHGYPFSYS